jgi:hypothetical protein
MPATSKCFGQGPTVGYDFGGDGARTMMLVYVWRQLAKKRWREFMCTRCMLRKLGRPLIPQWDFRKPWWNDERLRRIKVLFGDSPDSADEVSTMTRG